MGISSFNPHFAPLSKGEHWRRTGVYLAHTVCNTTLTMILGHTWVTTFFLKSLYETFWNCWPFLLFLVNVHLLGILPFAVWNYWWCLWEERVFLFQIQCKQRTLPDFQILWFVEIAILKCNYGESWSRGIDHYIQ